MAGCPNGVFRPNSLICTAHTCPWSPTLAQMFTPGTREVLGEAVGNAPMSAPVPPLLPLPSLGWCEEQAVGIPFASHRAGTEWAGTGPELHTGAASPWRAAPVIPSTALEGREQPWWCPGPPLHPAEHGSMEALGLQELA